MLTKVDITNYRGFKTYQMDGLTTVNLLVGKNNSGKTALLEGIHLVASGGDPAVLAEIATRRGEVSSGNLPDVTHFFHGHELKEGGFWAVHADNGFPKLTVRLVSHEQEDLFETDQSSRFGLGIVFEGAAPWVHEGPLPVSESGAMYVQRMRLRPGGTVDSGEKRFTAFVPPESLGAGRLSDHWRQVILEGRQDAVVSAMGLIEEKLASIIFLPGITSTRLHNSPAGIVAQLHGTPRPVPLGSMGDGMRRFFALACTLSNAASGFVFLDEIDTGLHYSVLQNMWRLVIQTAIDNRAQIFATTHSRDCIDALHLLCKRMPTFKEHVAVHKIDRVIDHSVCLRGDEFMRGVEGGVELR